MLAALGFLTILPVPHDRIRGGELRAAAGWFPVVGLLVGAVAAGVFAGVDAVAGSELAAALALLAAAVLTRGLHEDGLADVADALGSHGGPEVRARALRDPAVGAHGALALGLWLLVAFAALSGLATRDAVCALVAGAVLSRWAVVLQAAVLRGRGAGGLGSRFVATPLQLAAASAVAVAVTAGAGRGAMGAICLGVAGAVAVAFGHAVARALGGLNGDVFGATIKVVEVAVYVTLAVAWR